MFSFYLESLGKMLKYDRPLETSLHGCTFAWGILFFSILENERLTFLEVGFVTFLGVEG